MRTWNQGPLFLALALLTLFAYLPALNGDFVWDDQENITHNRTLRDLQGLYRIWSEPTSNVQYLPLTHTSFWIEYHLWGLNRMGYRLVNILLHAGSACLLCLFLQRLNIRGAWMAGILFALHPVATESVAWITERKNTLSGFFCLLALCFYPSLRNTDSLRPKSDKKGYGLSLFFYLCALASKQVSCTLTAVIPLLIWYKRGRITKNDLLLLLPWVTAGAAIGLIATGQEIHHVGAQGEEFARSPWERCLIAGRAASFYPRKLLWPTELTFIYPRWSIDPTSFSQALFPLGLLLGVIALWRLRHRLGRGTITALGIFLAPMLPALGFFNIYATLFSFVCDHWQYHSMPALIAPIASLAVGLLSPLSNRPALRLVVGLLIAEMTLLTWNQAHIYRGPATLWEDTLRKNPSAWLAHHNLGYVTDASQPARAEVRMTRALRIRPHYAKAHNNLGETLIRQGKPEMALTHFRAALKVLPHDSTGDPETAASAHNNIGNTLASLGRIPEALSSFNEALALKPDFAAAHNNLGALLAEEGDLEEAIRCFRRALEIDPGYESAQRNLALAITQIKK
jgi:tetratricopeptide (TPR) repeat protein